VIVIDAELSRLIQPRAFSFVTKRCNECVSAGDDAEYSWGGVRNFVGCGESNSKVNDAMIGSEESTSEFVISELRYW
jgi:hypothetical protein